MKALQIDSNNIIINVFEVNSSWSYASDQRSTIGLQGAPEMGNVYDSDQNACYNPQPFDSWSLDSDWNWQPPVQPNRSETHDTNGARIQIIEWNENTTSWDVIEQRDSGQAEWYPV